MEEQFVKETEIQELSNIEKKNELKESIKKSKIILMNMHNNLKFAEGELIDYYIYQIMSATMLRKTDFYNIVFLLNFFRSY